MRHNFHVTKAEHGWVGRKENKHFLELYYRNNTSKLFAAFIDDADLTNEEIERLKKMLEAKKGTVP